MDIRSVIDNSKMGWLQYATVFICFLMNTLDGMDVLVISYAAPAIAEAWGTSPQALGVVFSIGLFGMTTGALFLAPRTDVIGRKPMILFSSLLMGISIYMTSYATSLNELIIYRFVSGLGIGAMLASTPALASEYTPNKSRDFWVSFVVGGYPIGATLSGLAAAQIIPEYGWQGIFRMAGIVTLITVPLILILLSESLDFLVNSQKPNALKRINRILRRMALQELESLPPAREKEKKSKISQLFKEVDKKATFMILAAFFTSFMVLYFLVSWIPKLAVNTGLTLELAIYAGTVFNLGSIFGINLQGYLSTKFGLRKVIAVFLIGSALLMIVFGFFEGNVIVLVLFGLIGFFMQGGFVGLYAIAARIYPSHIRTTGIGWVIGAGRLGALFGPMIGGFLVAAGLSMAMNFVVFAIPTIIAGVITYMIKSDRVS